MIEYNYEVDFCLDKEVDYTHWLNRVLESENRIAGQINYIFCSDNYLLQLNKKYLDHNTLTDILTFDYSDEVAISGDVFISLDRVKENAEELNEDFLRELNRVMVHGVLHMIGYTDKSEEGRKQMRRLENEKMKLFHVEQ
ncbi:MAG: rRNA maturation RNase YbeY [Eudoraea sp.]|nr:rRNA maturation RNase YbeY [Eudoraea sp.]